MQSSNTGSKSSIPPCMLSIWALVQGDTVKEKFPWLQNLAASAYYGTLLEMIFV